MAAPRQIVSYVPQGTRRNESRPPAPTVEPTPDELAHISRALQLLEEANPRPGVMTTANDQLASLIQTLMAEDAQKRGRFETAANNTLEVRFDAHDVLWLTNVAITKLRNLKKFDWQTPGEPAAIPSKYRISMLADWGTGLYGAPVCAETIETMAHDSNKRADMVLHLGDVYYSGTNEEIDARFLALWPTVPDALNRALNGNHEMYAGGHGYYDRVLKSAKFDQSASCFALTNDHWVLACLDTAYDDHDLHGAQAEWLNGIAANLQGRRLVLFSHHQPFSLLDSQGPKLVEKLAPLLKAKQIYAWYWGHEHRCVMYEKHEFWGLYGRCVGHSGFPYFRDKILGAPSAAPEWVRLEGKNLVPGANVLKGVNQYVDKHPDEYGPNGFVTLEFDGPELIETVHAADGDMLWKRPVGDD